MLLLSLALLAAAPSPLTLDEALAEAARGNADVQLARASADLAGVDVYASYAGVLPRLDLSAAFGHDFTGAGTLVTTVPVLDRNGIPTVDPSTGLPVFRQEIVP